MRPIPYLLLISLALCFCQDRQAAAQSHWNSFGVRGGFATDDKDNGATQYEAFALYQLPWDLRSGSGWGVSTRIDLTAGLLTSQDEYSFVGAVGPSFGLGNPAFPLEMDLGISVALLSRDKFGHRDYNGMTQFVSHGGLVYRFCPRFGLSYRFQHMSNAGFSGGPNPGINTHLIGANWYFTP